MELASKYNDQSPLENMHCAVTFELLRREKNAFLRSEDITSMRKPLIRAILGTDMAKHAEQMTRLVALIDFLKHDEYEMGAGLPWYWPATPPAGSSEEQRRAWKLRLQEEFVMELFLHAADLGNSTLPFSQWCKWNRLIQQEFYSQGDREVQEFGALISPPAGYDRACGAAAERNFTKGFMEHLVKPFFDRLGDLTAITSAGSVAGGVNIQPVLGNMRTNLKIWEKKMALELSAASIERPSGGPEPARARFKSEGDKENAEKAADDDALLVQHNHSRRRKTTGKAFRSRFDTSESSVDAGIGSLQLGASL
jgi:high affinity cGMP-specific 3',5'-cyclic phosphodiesterase 9